MEIGLENIKHMSTRGFVLRVVALLLLMASMSCIGKGLQASGPNPVGSMFKVIGHSFSGEYLIIEYEIKFPGMTKVKMFDDEDKLLWRSQYVDDVTGVHRMVLRASRMSSGSYRFEFDYKNNYNSYIVQR